MFNTENLTFWVALKIHATNSKFVYYERNFGKNNSTLKVSNIYGLTPLEMRNSHN